MQMWCIMLRLMTIPLLAWPTIEKIHHLEKNPNVKANCKSHGGQKQLSRRAFSIAGLLGSG